MEFSLCKKSISDFEHKQLKLYLLHKEYNAKKKRLKKKEEEEGEKKL